MDDEVKPKKSKKKLEWLNQITYLPGSRSNSTLTENRQTNAGKTRLLPFPSKPPDLKPDKNVELCKQRLPRLKELLDVPFLKYHDKASNEMPITIVSRWDRQHVLESMLLLTPAPKTLQVFRCLIAPGCIISSDTEWNKHRGLDNAYHKRAHLAWIVQFRGGT